ncbi:MAG TPA: acyl carrier protein [Cellvibrio sp.]|nr:acyl carrier protein [Cellvibrio sp.]
MNIESIRQQLRSFILENYLFTDDPAALADDSSFLDGGILDSMGILELIDFLDESFAIKVEGDELIPDNLDSIDNLIAFIGKKLQA